MRHRTARGWLSGTLVVAGAATAVVAAGFSTYVTHPFPLKPRFDGISHYIRYHDGFHDGHSHDGYGHGFHDDGYQSFTVHSLLKPRLGGPGGADFHDAFHHGHSYNTNTHLQKGVGPEHPGEWGSQLSSPHSGEQRIGEAILLLTEGGPQDPER